MSTSRQRSAARRRRAAAASVASRSNGRSTRADDRPAGTNGSTAGGRTAGRRSNGWRSPPVRRGPAVSTAPAGEGPPLEEGPTPGGERPSLEDEAPPGPARWVPRLAFVLCLLGLADAIYLTYVHFHPGALVCSSSGTFNCAKVQTSPQSMVFGVIPVAILGLAYFAPMTVLNLPQAWRMADIRVAWLRLAGVVVGMGMVIYLVIAELFQIKAICEYCTGIHVITFALFVTTVLSYPAVSYRARWLTWARSEGAS